MKYVIYTDYKANSPKSYNYEAIEAKTLEEAIEKADALWNAEADSIYLMRIMKKVGKVETPYHAGYKFETYEAILCRRSYGWHRNTTENAEGSHRVNKNWLTNNRNEIWYEIA